ncbi:hypothetical protein D3C81_1719140 [compost metagenome]
MYLPHQPVQVEEGDQVGERIGAGALHRDAVNLQAPGLQLLDHRASQPQFRSPHMHVMALGEQGIQ